ncbi:MAG: PilZ domain-containing protein [Phycisphaerales bacterium]|nr:MAG: PilZ domain-containing protein [Phycisphaerales bacterium]
MDRENERRTEQRLRYYWPIWFAENVDRQLSQGQMVDISSRGAAFTCYAEHDCPYPGQYITARFSVPRYGADDAFDMANFTRSGHVCRVENVNSFLRRVAFQFADPLPFKPGEQAGDTTDADQSLEPVTV